MVDFGGHLRFTVNGAPLTIRGKFESDRTNLNIAVVTNEDGSIAQTAKPTAHMFTVDFEDSDPNVNSPILNWQAIMTGGPYNITIVEEDTGVMHTITGGRFGGKPKSDRLTGQVTGVEIYAPRGGYKMMIT